MEQLAWLLWIILGVVLIIAEIFTLVSCFFGSASVRLRRLSPVMLGVGVVGQFVIFALVSVVLTAMSRTIFANYYSHGDEDDCKNGH